MEKVSVVILAGGMGSRIGGAKSLQLLQGKPLLDWVLEAIRPQCDEVLISANGDPAAFTRCGCRVIADRIPGYAGPLAGLQSAMHSASHGLIASVPCDTPFLPGDLILQLYAALRSANAEAAVARVGGREQSAVTLYINQLETKLDTFLEAGERKVMSWQDTLHTSFVDFEDATAFLNINTAADLARANQRMQNGGSGGDTQRTSS